MVNIPIGGEDAPDVKVDPYEEVGLTGLSRSGLGFGYVNEEWLSDIRKSNSHGVGIFREMADNNVAVNAILFLADSLVRGLSFEIDSGPADDPRADELAEFVQTCLDDLRQSWPNIMGEIVRNVIVYGWDTHELTYKRRNGATDDARTTSDYSDGRVGWSSIAPRSPDSRDAWAFDETGRVKGLYQMTAPSYDVRYIPIEKLLHVTSTGATKMNPEGRSCLRGCYTSYYMLKRIQQSEMIGISRNLQGVPTLEVPIRLLSAGATAEEKALLEQFKQMVSRVRNDSYAGLVLPSSTDQQGKPSGYRFNLLQTGSTGKTVEVGATISRLSTDISRAFLADWLYLGSGAGSSGSWSLASVRTNNFAQCLSGFLASCIDAVNRHVIPQLMRLNGVSDARLYPTMRHGDLEGRPIEEIAPHAASLVSAGLLTPDDETERWLRELLGAPEIESGPDDRPSVFDLEPTEEDALIEEAPRALEPDEPDEPEDVAPISAVTLNGAQIASLLSIIEQVNGGQLPRDVAVGIISKAFNMEPEEASNLLGEVGRGFRPRQENEGGPDAV